MLHNSDVQRAVIRVKGSDASNVPRRTQKSSQVNAFTQTMSKWIFSIRLTKSCTYKYVRVQEHTCKET